MISQFDRMPKICILGLGYVGLPLMVEFSKHYDVVGFDIDKTRTAELKNGIDRTRETSDVELNSLKNAIFTSKISDIVDCNVYIITVPTPINDDNSPNLEPLISASKIVSNVLKSGDFVIYESTVYPGVTEDICVPILEEGSGLEFDDGSGVEKFGMFFVGYSPERINPGDKAHRVNEIVKVTSGSSPAALNFIDNLYCSIIEAGTFRATSIKTAEAAKVIENIQRDVNIALVNELCMLFGELALDTEAVLQAAGTKWNFLPFRPGLVGGHCIGVDPYYLTHKAEQIGYKPEMILAGRRINNSMSEYAGRRIMSLMEKHHFDFCSAKILIMGLTFKENCPDTRNSKVVDLVNFLVEKNLEVDVFDPYLSDKNVPNSLKGSFVSKPEKGFYDCIVLAVGHDEFKQMGVSLIRQYGNSEHVLFDLKYVFQSSETDDRL